MDGFVETVTSGPLPRLGDELTRMAAEVVKSGPSEVAGQHLLRLELVLPESV